jgi:hypothetical protein
VKKAKIDVEIEPGVHVTVTAEGETSAVAMDRAYSRSVAIMRFMEAVEAEVLEPEIRGRRGQS